MASAVMTTLLNGSGLVSDLTQTKFAVESLQYAKDCRGEDVAHRMQVGEVERRRVDNARRNVDEKAAQLKSISHLSALIAGFSMVTMVEVTIPENANRVLVALFAAASSTTVRSPPAPPPPPPERPHCASPSHPSYPYYRPVCGFSLPLARGPTATAGRSNTAFLPSFLSFRKPPPPGGPDADCDDDLHACDGGPLQLRPRQATGRVGLHLLQPLLEHEGQRRVGAIALGLLPRWVLGSAARPGSARLCALGSARSLARPPE